MNSCLFFDLDGTLLDSRRLLTASVNSVRESRQLRPLSEKNIASYFGGTINTVLDRSLAGISGISLPEAHEQLHQHYLRHFSALTGVFPGVPTGLAELCAAGFVNIVLTEQPEQLARQVLSQHDLLRFSETIREVPPGDDIGLILRDLLDEYGSDGAESGIFSHREEDLKAGRAAGLYTAFPRYSFFDPPAYDCELAADAFADFAQEMILKKMGRLT